MTMHSPSHSTYSRHEYGIVGAVAITSMSSCRFHKALSASEVASPRTASRSIRGQSPSISHDFWGSCPFASSRGDAGASGVGCGSKGSAPVIFWKSKSTPTWRTSCSGNRHGGCGRKFYTNSMEYCGRVISSEVRCEHLFQQSGSLVQPAKHLKLVSLRCRETTSSECALRRRSDEGATGSS